MQPDIRFKCNGAEKFDFSKGEWRAVEDCSPDTNIAGRMGRDAQGMVFPYGAVLMRSRITHLFFEADN